MIATPLSLKGRALQWLSQREHSRQELRRKLLTYLRNAARRAAQRPPLAAPSLTPCAAPPRAGVPAPGEGRTGSAAGGLGRAADVGDVVDAVPDVQAEVEAVLDWLTQNRYLSDARFVESRVHVRGARYGNLRIRQELAQHGVALSAEQSQHLQATELERARAVWLRKFGAVPPADLRERAKHLRFMAARGFSAAVIGRVLKQAGAVQDDGDDTDAA